MIRLIQNGSEPTHVPERIITDLRARERNGLVVLPAKLSLQRGDQVRIVRGPLVDRLAIFDGMKGSERAAVLLTMLGSEQRVELSRRDVEPSDRIALAARWQDLASNVNAGRAGGGFVIK